VPRSAGSKASGPDFVAFRAAQVFVLPKVLLHVLRLPPVAVITVAVRR
jgi:hypothetical protein